MNNENRKKEKINKKTNKEDIEKGKRKGGKKNI
jgi:hypothetical protein